MQGIGIRLKNKYINDSFKRSGTCFYRSGSEINKELFSGKTKRKNVRTFHVQLLFQRTTEAYSNCVATSNSQLEILAAFISSCESTFKKK